MTDIVVDRRHNLGLRRATDLTDTIARRLRAEFDVSSYWDGETLHFTRRGASGHVTVTEHHLRLRIELGILLYPLRARIARTVLAFLDEHLADDGRQRLRPGIRRSAGTRSSRSHGTSKSVRPK